MDRLLDRCTADAILSARLSSLYEHPIASNQEWPELIETLDRDVGIPVNREDAGSWVADSVARYQAAHGELTEDELELVAGEHFVIEE